MPKSTHFHQAKDAMVTDNNFVQRMKAYTLKKSRSCELQTKKRKKRSQCRKMIS